MLRYQSEATILLQTELCLAHTWRLLNLTAPYGPRDAQLVTEYQAYEAALTARMKISAEFDERMHPAKYSSLERSVRRLRYKRAMQEQAAPLDAALEEYRAAFGVTVGRQ